MRRGGKGREKAEERRGGLTGGASRKGGAEGCPGIRRTHKPGKEVRKEWGYPDMGIYAGDMQFFVK